MQVVKSFHEVLRSAQSAHQLSLILRYKESILPYTVFEGLFWVGRVRAKAVERRAFCRVLETPRPVHVLRL